MNHRPYLSVILATHNRRDVVLHTLAALGQCGLDRRDYEVIVVDNASRDGTADALARLRGVRVRRLSRNRGACAKAVGVPMARAPILLFLDDDAYPRPHCLDRMLLRFEIDPTLGAAGFTAHLPDGRQECSALPHVFVGCGVGLRAAALHAVGGIDASLFMAAEEYDLSFRLLQAGWRVEIFKDLQVEHRKSAVARRRRRISFYDICNNLRIIARYLPEPWARVYRDDWTQRYAWLAASAGHETAFARGLRFGRRCARSDRRRYRHRRLGPEVLEAVFGWERIERRMCGLAAAGVRRIVLADLGKNVYAFHRAAQRAGLAVVAVADDRLGLGDRRYRGVPIMETPAALSLRPDAIVVSNTSYVHAPLRKRDLSARTNTPVYNWFDPPREMAIPDPVASRPAAPAGVLTPV